MAQQGGTYRLPKGFNSFLSLVYLHLSWSYLISIGGSNFAIRSETSARTYDDDKSDDVEWEVITKEDADETKTNSCPRRMSSHFDIRLGYGERKITLFSMDVDIEKHNHSRIQPQEK